MVARLGAPRPRAPGLPGAARRAYRRLQGLLYRGDRVTCPCCGGRFRAFAAFGDPPRPGACCPGCGSLERHRLLWLYLKRRTELFVGPRRVLHVAPEPLFSERLAALPQITYLSVDLDSPLAMVRMDATRLALPDHSFDVVLCLHVLEHIPDDRAAMREFRRVLKPGGWGILQSPVDPQRATTYEDWSVESPKARRRVFGQSDHVRIYGRDYLDRLRESGFAVEENPFAAELPPGEAERFGILRDEALTVCRPREGAGASLR